VRHLNIAISSLSGETLAGQRITGDRALKRLRCWRCLPACHMLRLLRILALGVAGAMEAGGASAPSR